LQFTLDDIEDLRLAVDEACAALVERAVEGARLELQYEVDATRLIIEGRCPVNGGAPLELHPVAEAVLASTVDDHAVRQLDEVGHFRLIKRLPG